MSHDAKENSVESGAPVELYTFTRGSRVWRFTSSDADVTYQTNDYAADTIERTSIEATPEAARSAMRLVVRRDFTIANLFRVSPPTDVIALTVTRYHRGESNGVVMWMGRITNVEWSGSQATINCEPVSTSLKRTGLRRLYQRQCPHVLYSSACGVNAASYRLTGTVTAVGTVTLTVDSASSRSDGWFNGGYVEWERPGDNYDRRMVKSHVGDVLTLTTPLTGISEGDTVRMYPGCAHNTGANGCARFDNLLNYGGFPHIPKKNPFGGSPIY